jgi:hypothetical protein
MYLIYLLHIEWNKPIRGAVVVVKTSCALNVISTLLLDTLWFHMVSVRVMVFNATSALHLTTLVLIDTDCIDSL